MHESWPQIRALLLLCLYAALAGCASAPPKEPADTAATRIEDSAHGWWYARFRPVWPEAAGPKWHLDPLIAVEVVAPVLERHRNDITLWRFHRRAARDAAGHQFSFIFYSSPEAAERVFADLRSSPVLGELESAGLMASIGYDKTSEITRPTIGATSDRNWSEPLQRSWPYFIMGVSQTWLALAREYAERETEAASASGLAAKYERVNQALTEHWQEEGGHAFLHHLSGVFGYKPLLIHQQF